MTASNPSLVRSAGAAAQLQPVQASVGTSDDSQTSRIHACTAARGDLLRNRLE